MINVTQIGIGYWGSNILRNLLEIEDVNVWCLCDLNFKKVNDATIKHKLCSSKNFRGICSVFPIGETLEKTDCFVISTGANTHYELALKAIEARKHVFVEKPLTLSSIHARHLIEKAKENNVKIMVGHTFLFNSSIRKLKEITSNKNYFGEIIYAYFQRLSLGQVKEDISAAWNLMPHDISIANYLFDGKPKKISASGLRYLNKNIDDVAFVNLEYENNKMAHIHVSWLDPSKTRKVVVVGEKKMAIADDMNNEGKLWLYDKGADFIPRDDGQTHGIKLRSGDIIIPQISTKEPLKEELQHFIDCVKNNKEPFTNGQNGLDVVESLEEIQHQLDDNK